MDLKRLFHVLVVGGSMLASKGCAEESGNGKDTSDGALADTSASPLPDAEEGRNGKDAADGALADTSISPQPDAGADAPNDEARDAGATSAEVAADTDGIKGASCFCGPQSKCCTSQGDGMSVPAAGVVCCWSTRCQ